MPLKEERQQRRQLHKERAQKDKMEFLRNLPLAQQTITDLFDNLDSELEFNGCEHDYTLTDRFLALQEIKLTDQMIEWFQDNGGYCDCEILWNIEEKFE